MLEVGCANGPGGADDPGLSDDETASHFGAWCIVSSPLILSNDLNNATIMDKIWPIITNTDALRVNQAWGGFSGSVFLQASTNITLHDLVNATGPIPLWQAFYKPLGDEVGSVAVLVMNHDAAPATIAIPLTLVPGLASAVNSVKAFDVWEQKAIGPISTSWSVTLRTHQSAFVILALP